MKNIIFYPTWLIGCVPWISGLVVGNYVLWALGIGMLMGMFTIQVIEVNIQRKNGNS